MLDFRAFCGCCGKGEKLNWSNSEVTCPTAQNTDKRLLSEERKCITAAVRINANAAPHFIFTTRSVRK